MVTESKGCSNDSLPGQPIFILGILPRCGTNFLQDLICAHPDCAPPAPIWEDFLVAHADHLSRYVDRVSQRWDPRWGETNRLSDQLMANLGAGLTSFLGERAGHKRVATKTPSVENLECFFRLLPEAHLIILVRDGRAVIESGIRSFGWNREWATHKWVRAVDRIFEFEEKHSQADSRYRTVRYEDLYENQEDELRSIFDFVNLDADSYDFEEASLLPVRGSSTTRDAAPEVHWDPVARQTNFDPMSRFSHWSRAQHERFNWVAGKHLEHLGYKPERASSGRAFWVAWNLILDVRWQAMRLIAPIYLKVKRRNSLREIVSC